MIEAAQRKLREAAFFLRRLHGNEPNEPEAFQFHLSAFLAAARSVLYALADEQQGKYQSWFHQWKKANEAEYEFWKQMTDQRNAEIHHSGAETSAEWQTSPVVDVLSASAGGHHGQSRQGYLVHWYGMPWDEKPKLRREVHFIKLGENEVEAIETCKRLLDLVTKLTQDFDNAHPAQ